MKDWRSKLKVANVLHLVFYVGKWILYTACCLTSYFLIFRPDKEE